MYGFVCGFCLALGLSVCWVGNLCLFVHLRSYVWHGVCLFDRLNKLCLAWGLSVCPSEQVMFGMWFVCLSV